MTRGLSTTLNKNMFKGCWGVPTISSGNQIFSTWQVPRKFKWSWLNADPWLVMAMCHQTCKQEIFLASHSQPSTMNTIDRKTEYHGVIENTRGCTTHYPSILRATRSFVVNLASFSQFSRLTYCSLSLQGYIDIFAEWHRNEARLYRPIVMQLLKVMFALSFPVVHKV